VFVELFVGVAEGLVVEVGDEVIVGVCEGVSERVGVDV